MSGGHVLVQGLDGQCARYIAVLLVHVVCSGARVVAEPDSEVLDCQGPLLGDLQVRSGRVLVVVDGRGYLVDGDDFTAGLLDLPGLLQEVPEARLCDLGVGGKDAHSVELGNAVIVGGELASDDLELVETRHVCRCCCWVVGR